MNGNLPEETTAENYIDFRQEIDEKIEKGRKMFPQWISTCILVIINLLHH